DRRAAECSRRAARQRDGEQSGARSPWHSACAKPRGARLDAARHPGGVPERQSLPSQAGPGSRALHCLRPENSIVDQFSGGASTRPTRVDTKLESEIELRRFCQTTVYERPVAREL